MSNSNIIESTEEISLGELVQMIKRTYSFLRSKILQIFFFGITGAGIFFIQSYFEKPIYKASLTFAIDDVGGNSGNLGGAIGLASSLGFEVGSSGGVFASSNLNELMKSRFVVEKTLLSPVLVNGDTLSFAEYYIRNNNLRKAWLKRDDLKNLQFPYNPDRTKFNINQDSILEILYKNLTDKKNLSIQQKDKKVSFTTVDVFNNDQLFAKQFCLKLVQVTSDFYIETKSKKTKNNVDILQKQLDSVRQELNEVIYKAAGNYDNVYNLNPSLTKRATPAKKNQIDIQANSALLTQLVGQLELAKISLRKETPLVQIIDKPILPLEKVNMDKLKFSLLGAFLFSFIYIIYLLVDKKLNSF